MQEVVKMVLEAIYEESLNTLRMVSVPKRSCHTALKQIEKSFCGVKWYIEGDIKGFFDNINHDVMIGILEERINDVRFIRLIRKFLNAGYIEDWKYFHTYNGTPQGGIISPVLANIYLDKLDRFMEDIIKRDTMGKYRRQNPEYSKLRYQLNKAISAHDIKEIKRLRKELRSTSSVDNFDSSFRRVHYVRYADDFLIGTMSSKAYAEQLKQEIKQFLEEELHLRLSEEKTVITREKRESILSWLSHKQEVSLT